MIVWAFLNYFKWYLWIIYALNKLINIKVSSVKSAWSALFEISNAFDALSTFTHQIAHFISSCNKIELNNTVNDINNLEMSLMFV